MSLSSQADVRIVEELRAREEALEAKVSSLQDALHESEAQRASLKRAHPFSTVPLSRHKSNQKTATISPSLTARPCLITLSSGALQDGVGQLRGDLESALQKLKQHKQESVRASSEQAAQAELDRTEYRQQIRGARARRCERRGVYCSAPCACDKRALFAQRCN